MICLYVVCILVSLFGCVQSCVTEEKITAIDTAVTGLIGQLLIDGYITLTPAAALVGTVTDLLNGLCTTPALKTTLETIDTHIGNCTQVLDNATSFQSLNVEGVDLGTVFIDFDNIDHFCECRTDVAAAWAYSPLVAQFTQQHTGSIYNATANVDVICSTAETKAGIAALATSSANCTAPVHKQAGLTTQEKLDHLGRLAIFVATADCVSYDAALWNCTHHYAKQSFAQQCMNWAAGLGSNKVPCGKYTCIKTFDRHCGAGSSALYIDAVNVENPGALLENEDTCTSYTDVTCVTSAKLETVNTASQTVIGGLADYVDASSGTPVVQDSDIPALLSRLCINLTAKMTELKTELDNCRALAVLAPGLQSLTLKGTSFADFFAMFPDVSTFCGCISDISKAWELKDNAASQVHIDPLAAYINIADVESICGNTLKGLIESIESASTACKSSLEDLAGFSDADNKNFDDIHALVQGCNESVDVAADWTCMTDEAKTNAFKTCILDEDNKSADRALCGKRDCVSTEMQGCSDSARKLYIRAVNIENSDKKIEENSDNCDGTRGLKLSVFALAACLFSLGVNKFL